MSRLRALPAALALLVVAACGTATDPGPAVKGDEPSGATGGAVESPAPTPSTEGATEGATDAWPTDGRTVQAAAAAFVVAVNTYGPDDLDRAGRLPGYRDRVAALLTPSFAETFLASLGAAEESVAERGAERTGEVVATGVASLGADAAEVLVTGQVQQSDAEPAVFRVVVTLVRAGGRWLVDGFSAVDGGTGGTGGTGEGPGVAGSDPGSLPEPAVAARARAVEAAEVVLAYDYRDLDAVLERALPLLTASYGEQFSDVFESLVRVNAERTRTSVEADPVAAGIREVGPDQVEVLLFVDRVTLSRGPRTTATSDQATFVMRLVGGAWLVDEVRTS